jgi:hypothetical protein
LSGGGGEGTCHSNPRENHGSIGAGLGSITTFQRKLPTKISNEPPSRNAEMDTQSLRVCRSRA